MSLIAGLIVAHLKLTLGAIDLKEYNMKSCTVLLFLVAEICFSCIHAVEGTRIQPSYQVEHLEQKQSHLFKIYNVYEQLESLGYIHPSLGLAKYETMELAILGSISSMMNYKSTPRHLINIKDRVIERLDKDGSFSVFIAFESLAEGNEYLHLEGHIDMDTLKLNIEHQKQLSRKEFNAIKEIGPPSVFQGWYKKMSYGSSGFNNGSKDIDVLTGLCESTKCVNGTQGVCDRGQVVIDPWLNSSITFQRRLAKDRPINYVQWVGSHNSFNNRADGYGSHDTVIDKILKLVTRGKQNFVWAQQYFTITDQLTMGSRYFMLNPVYVWSEMRLCHGGVYSPAFDKLVSYIEKILHKTIKFDSADLGCVPSDRQFSAAIQELHDWLVLPGHESEVILLMIDDYGESKDWNRQDLIWGPIQDILGDMVFNKTLKKTAFPNSWPSQNQMLSLGKRVLIMGTDRVVNDYIFLDMTQPTWDKDTMKYFTPYPDCQGFKPGSWFVQGGESQLIGKIYNGPEEEGLIVPANYQKVVQCPVNIFKLDLISPGLLQSSIWSWMDNLSTASLTSGKCAVMMDGFAGRWTTVDCSSTRCYHVCTNSTSVVLDSTLSTSDSASCPSGFTAGCPLDGYENWQIFTSLVSKPATSNGDSRCAWLDLSKFT